MLRFLPVSVAALALLACSPASGGDTQGADDGAKPSNSTDVIRGSSGDSVGAEPATDAGQTGAVQTNVVQPSGGADRPCDQNNVGGVWSLVHIEVADANVRDFYRTAPFEYMRVGPTGAYSYFATPSAVSNLTEVRNRLDQADAADGVNDRIQVPSPGLFVVVRNGQPFQAFTCMIAGRAQASHQPGDMVWTEYPGTGDIYRVQRRIGQ